MGGRDGLHRDRGEIGKAERHAEPDQGELGELARRRPRRAGKPQDQPAQHARKRRPAEAHHHGRHLRHRHPGRREGQAEQRDAEHAQRHADELAPGLVGRCGHGW